MWFGHVERISHEYYHAIFQDVGQERPNTEYKKCRAFFKLKNNIRIVSRGLLYSMPTAFKGNGRDGVYVYISKLY